MRIYAKIYSIITVALGAFNACSLIHDDPEDCQLYTSEGVPYAYVAVAFNTGMNTSTRSNPTGGEDGDGQEVGQSNENQVNDITLFFYEATDKVKGVNSDPETSIVARHHFKNGEFTYNGGTNAQTNPVEVTDLLVNHSYHVLAVVNGGERFGVKVATLGELQQKTVTSIYSQDNGYSNFLMASADDEKPSLVILPNNSESRPAQTVINVERVSARVDYRAQGSEVNTDSTYLVGENGTLGTAKITGAMLMNVLDAEAPSWLLKRVADSWGSTDVEYLGKETYQGVASATASNYVIDAIENKSSGSFVPATYYKNFGYGDPTNADDISLAWEADANYTTLFTNEGYNCIGYPKENVNQQGDKALTTGVVFRAQYTPTGMSKGQTFFEYNGEVYATLKDLMQGFNEINWNNYIANNTNVWWPDVVTWNDLQTYIINQLREDPVGYRAFLASEYAKIEAASLSDNISEDDKTRLLWDSYLKSECKYIVDDKGVAVDSGDGTVSGTTRRVLHETSDGQIRTFKDGICYYTYWIKHANDQDKNNDLVGVKDKTGGVMEYAIVRNNLYKLDVTSITGPGGDIPGDRNVNVNVLVEDWILMNKEEIDLNPAGNTEEEGA